MLVAACEKVGLSRCGNNRHLQMHLVALTEGARLISLHDMRSAVLSYLGDLQLYNLKWNLQSASRLLTGGSPVLQTT